MRNKQIDYLKGILIVSVVIGHFLELILKNNIARGLYIIIYSMHMPLFIFTTGYFSKCNIKKIATKQFIPFLFFSIIYQIFAIAIHDIKKPQITTPYWILWYLFATIVWNVSSGLWQNQRKEVKYIILAFSIFSSLLVGYCPMIGRKYSLSRIIVFFPFFILGNMWRKKELNFYISSKIQKIVWSSTALLLCGILYWNQARIKYSWLYEATSYEAGKYTIMIRICHLIFSYFMVVILMNNIPEQKENIFTNIGQHTMFIFLIHGFIVKYLKYIDITKMIMTIPNKIIAVIIMITTAIIVILGLFCFDIFVFAISGNSKGNSNKK